MLNLSSDVISVTLEVLKDECNGKHGNFTKLCTTGIVIWNAECLYDDDSSSSSKSHHTS